MERTTRLSLLACLKIGTSVLNFATQSAHTSLVRLVPLAYDEASQHCCSFSHLIIKKQIADDEARTRNNLLGRQGLYQLSYVRILLNFQCLFCFCNSIGRFCSQATFTLRVKELRIHLAKFYNKTNIFSIIFFSY